MDCSFISHQGLDYYKLWKWLGGILKFGIFCGLRGACVRAPLVRIILSVLKGRINSFSGRDRPVWYFMENKFAISPHTLG